MGTSQDVHECIRTRRSIRHFDKGRAVPEQALEKVLEAIQWAPSWVNFQVWEVVVVDDPDVKSRLRECVPASNPGREAVVDAPVLLAVCGRTGRSGMIGGEMGTVFGDWMLFDLGIACQNACLAAWAEGLGTLHLGWLDHAKAGEILAVPVGVQVVELIPLGYPARPGRPPKRRELAELTHRNRFGG